MPEYGPLEVAVLMGGASEERDVSLASGAQVARALREAGHRVVAVDTSRGVLDRDQEEAILAEGVRPEPPEPGTLDFLESGDLSLVTDSPELEAVDVIFPALHGGAGEDGTLQTLLDIAGIPYAGSGRVGCTLSMDKDISKRLLRDAGIPTPEWSTVLHPGRAGDPAVLLDGLVERLGLPLIVKPPSGGSTLGLTLAHDRAELDEAVEEALRFEEAVLFEAYVPGRELTVGVLGERALPVGEIIPAHEIFDYECKYQPGLAEEIFPAEIDEGMVERLGELTLRAHRLLRLADFSRADFIVDEDGQPWCLEANALPGLTSTSLLPQAAAAGGLAFPELCDRIVRLAIQRAGEGEGVRRRRRREQASRRSVQPDASGGG